MSSGIWNAPRISFTRGAGSIKTSTTSNRYGTRGSSSNLSHSLAPRMMRSSLGLGHSFVRRTECVGRAGFHFDEYQRFFMPIAADQIDLTAPFGAEVLIQQPKSI